MCVFTKCKNCYYTKEMKNKELLINKAVATNIDTEYHLYNSLMNKNVNIHITKYASKYDLMEINLENHKKYKKYLYVSS